MMEFSQAAAYYRSMEPSEKEDLVENIAESLMFENEDVIQTVLGHFARVDETLGKNLERRLYF